MEQKNVDCLITFSISISWSLKSVNGISGPINHEYIDYWIQVFNVRSVSP